MGLVSVSLPNPGDEANASDISTPFNQLLADYNGNINDSNVSTLSGTKIASGTLPVSAMNTAANPETRFDEALSDFVASGCVVSQVSGLNFQMTSGVVYVDGKRATVSAISSTALTASKDTYFSVSNAGVVSYTGSNVVANGAAAPTLPANSIWIAKVVTNGTTITSVTTTGSDSNGVPLYKTGAVGASNLVFGKVYRRQGGSATNWNTSGTTTYDVSGSDLKIQCGAIAVTADPITVTFPVAYTNIPLIFMQVITANTSNCFVRSSMQSTTGFTATCITDSGTGSVQQTISWMAIGI